MKQKLSHILGLIVCLALPVTVGAGSQSLGGVTLTEVTPRIITPNGDLLNDVIFFKFDETISGLPIESEVFDINGAKVSGMSMNSNEDALTWNGRDEGGQAVPSGIYIYSIKLGDRHASGTVVVAK